MQSFSRRLVEETTLSRQDLIWPIFLCEGSSQQQPISSMPGVFRYSLDQLPKLLKEVDKLGICAVALFPSLSQKYRSDDAQAAWDANGLIPTAIKQIKDSFPNIGVIADVALDPYTSHGQDGLMSKDGSIENDLTNEALVRQSLVLARSGADILAPSDMMDGRVLQIRTALEQENFKNVMILSYSAKYASNFYGPFRDAVATASRLGKGTKETYQMSPSNRQEAMREMQLDIHEGADFLMVKPALSYLDVICEARSKFDIPIFAYNVSAEYSMVKAAAENKWIDEKKTVLEILTSIKRAGASAIFSYHALDVARWLE